MAGNRKTRLTALRTAAVLSVFAAFAAQADTVPRLGCIYYGQVRNSFGRPCVESDGVRLTLWRGTNQVTWYDVKGTIGAGVNYQLQINAVSSGEKLDSGSAVEGETVQVAATAGVTPEHLVGNTNLVVQGGGVCILRDFVIGADADGDGLPDEWEQFMIDALGPSSGITNILQVGPGDDYDGDGASNLDEFRAGTFAFIASDVLKIESLEKLAGAAYKIKFFTTMGMTYGIQVRPDLVQGNWEMVPVDTTPAAQPLNTSVDGIGDFQSVYFSTNGFSQYFRLLSR